MNLTVPFFLGIIKVGEAHVESLHFFSTPNLQSLFHSFFRVDWQRVFFGTCSMLIATGEHQELAHVILMWFDNKVS